jgi:hypothetical protein
MVIRKEKIMNTNKRRTQKVLLLSLSILLVCVSIFAGACGKDKAKDDSDSGVEPTHYYWPLTGLDAPSEEATLLRPISIKIENTPEARPQLGMQDADVVYETVVEGGITRFNCIFQSTLPDEVGPVRSARLSDLWIVPQYDALFYFSGANKQVLAKIAASTISNLHHRINSPYHRVSFRKVPHNLYLYVNEVYEDATKAKFDINAKTVRSFLFGDLPKLEASASADATTETADTPDATDTTDATETTTPAESAYPSGLKGTVGFVTAWKVIWSYDAAQGVYLREQGGKPFMEAGTEKQIVSENVVILSATYTKQKASEDHAKGNTFDTNLGGSGKAWVLRDGVGIECTWKADATTPPRFFDTDGNEIPLKPGHTWIEVISQETEVTVE